MAIMSNEIAIKFIAFIVLTAIPAMFVYNMFTAKNECEAAAVAYAEAIRLSSFSPETKVKEARMQATCKAMGIQAEGYLMKLTPGK